jgi:hypothetical protein
MAQFFNVIKIHLILFNFILKMDVAQKVNDSNNVACITHLLHA